MDGMVKLRIAVSILLILEGGAIILAFAIPDQTDEYQEAYDSLNAEEQSAVDKFIERSPEESDAPYLVIGYMQYAVAIGLFILLAKIWNLKKI